MTIKEGAEYSVGITFLWVNDLVLYDDISVEGEIVSGLKFLQVVKRAGVKGR